MFDVEFGLAEYQPSPKYPAIPAMRIAGLD